MLTLWEALRNEEEWTGSLDDLVSHSNFLIESFPVAAVMHLPPRTRSTVTGYRSQKIISPAQGKSFLWLHLVQFCAARYLVENDWKRDKVAAWMQGQNGLSILKAIENIVRLSTSPTPTIYTAENLLSRAYLNVRLLAAGIIGQYQNVKRGVPVIQDNTLDPLLSRAMMGLASIYLLEGKDDLAGSVHELLARCSHPLHDAVWGLDSFSSADFPF